MFPMETLYWREKKYYYLSYIWRPLLIILYKININKLINLDKTVKSIVLISFFSKYYYPVEIQG